MTVELPTEGIAAPPRDNGEVIFDAPWQSRAFGLAAALVEDGRLAWSDFQTGLIAQVGKADAIGADTGQPEIYWNCWLETLGDLTAQTHTDDAGPMLDPDRWSLRCEEYAARPSGHDH